MSPTLWFTALSMLAAMVGLWLLKPVPETEVVAAGAAPDPRPDVLPARTR